MWCEPGARSAVKRVANSACPVPIFVTLQPVVSYPGESGIGPIDASATVGNDGAPLDADDDEHESSSSEASGSRRQAFDIGGEPSSIPIGGTIRPASTRSPACLQVVPSPCDRRLPRGLARRD